MKNAVRLILFLALALAARALTVGAYNVENYTLADRMVDGVYRKAYPKPEAEKQALRESIRGFAPDILALEEMGGPPFLAELAHYEYAEVILSNDDAEIAAIPHDRAGDLLAGVPVLSPLAWPLAYRFPVQRISADYQPTEAPALPTCLIMVRRRDDSIKFIESTPMTLRLIQLLKENPEATGLVIVNALADLFDPGERAAAIDGATRMLHDLRDRDVILGTRPA